MGAVDTQVWKAVFGKPADAVEKSVENDDECELSWCFPVCMLDSAFGLTSFSCIEDMIIDNDPPITRYVSIPKEMSQLSTSAFTAGIVEAVLDGLGFVRSVPDPIVGSFY